MANESMGLLGRKVGMTQVFQDDGNVVPVTVVEAGPCTVLQVKTSETKDGYSALLFGFGSQKKQRLNKAQLGQLKAAGCEDAPPRNRGEVRVPASVAAKHKVGDTVGAADVFTVGDYVDVSGTSKGRGFAGVFKRHNFAGFIRSHGTHEFFRHGGSIGTRLTPGHVLKGKKMPGQMGNKRVTVQNLKVVRVDTDRSLVYVRGGVPGPNGGLVTLRIAVKK
ncbi:MAG: large subunit ribosomal protein L3 [Polyangiales bacterium]|jgi:large subunit ribosomal protein L3